MVRSRRVGLALGGLSGLGLIPALALSCTGDPTAATVRSLERAGRVAFVCMGAPGSPASLRPLSDCTTERRESNDDFGDGSAVHLYALITLETRGEIAVVDVTSKVSNVLDHDVTTPGETPLPVGGQPVDVVVTPHGTAAFVAAAEPGRPGLYALDNRVLRPCEADSERCDEAPPTLASWPSCRLSSAPGAMVLVADPADADGNVRESCDASYEAPLNAEPTFGDITSEGLGRQKLYVTLPREGSLVVIDAQSLLEGEPGVFEDCVIERTVDLSAAVEPRRVTTIDPGPGCAVPEPVDPRPSGGYVSIPAGVSLVAPPGAVPGASGARLYVADLGAPKIHALDLSDPCEPFEDEGQALFPSSTEDPGRVVLTDRLAASGVTPSNKRYVYAIDFADRSVMAFDVSDGQTSREPIRISRPELNPFQPEDRVRFAAAPVDVLLLERDDPEADGSGVTPLGTQCDPRPCLGDEQCCNNDGDAQCDEGQTTQCEACSIGTEYRSSDDYEEGAGPFTLRGTFAVVALASGNLAVIDVEDYDAPCRGPSSPSEAAGCDDTALGGNTTDEPSCQVVAPFQQRSAYYLLTNDDVGRRQPGLQSFPVLSSDDGTVLKEGVQLIAPPPSGSVVTLAVGGDVVEVPADGVVVDDQGPRNTLTLNFKNPRVHQADQQWLITYRGALPGFDARVADVRIQDGLVLDDTARFCDLGVQSEQAVRESLSDSGLSSAEVDALSIRYADRLHIAEPLAASDSDYWSNASCSFQECRSAFGDETNPTVLRELRIFEAFQDHVTVAPPSQEEGALVECCFPTLVDYEVRPGDEWVLAGTASGFVHPVIARPGSGECRPSCDPRLALKTSRLRHSIGEEAVNIFDNALFRTAIVVSDAALLEVDMAFRFTTQSSFQPIRAALTSDDRGAVQAQQLGYVPATDELFVTDGALEGLLLVPGDLVGDVRQFY